jgi:hypothetical protein
MTITVAIKPSMNCPKSVPVIKVSFNIVFNE